MFDARDVEAEAIAELVLLLMFEASDVEAFNTDVLTAVTLVLVVVTLELTVARVVPSEVEAARTVLSV